MPVKSPKKNKKISTADLVLKGAERWLTTALEAKVLAKKMRFNLIPKDREFNGTVEDQLGFGCGPAKQQKYTEEKFMEGINDKEKQKELSLPFLHMANSILVAFINQCNEKGEKVPEIFSFQLTESKFVIRQNDRTKAKELTMEFHFKF